MSLITVITPVYNGDAYIESTIESVLQVCRNIKYEYIVINDGSTDETSIILARYSKQIRVENQENRGEAAAVNLGLSLANGKYVLIVSADDPLRSSQLIESGLEALDADDSIACVYPDWSVIDSESKIIRNVRVAEYSEDIIIGDGICIVGPGGIFRREQALEIGGRNSSYRFVSDYDFWLRLSRLGKFQRIPGYLAFWREHEDSTSISNRGVKMANERILMMRNFLDSNPDLPIKQKKRASASIYLQAARLVYFDNQIPSKRLLLKALWTYPKSIFKISPKVCCYIVLMPISPYILFGLRKLGLELKLRSDA